MLCPKCKMELLVKRDQGKTIRVCRNKACPNYKKPVRVNQNDSK